MWLLPALALVSSASVRVYYRFSTSGEPVPRSGPVLLVANHPNSLIDPGLVAAAASRPVRFLAKAPLFTDRKVGWLVRGSGSIPVYRRQDDPDLVGKNVDMFRAVHEALAAGSAVGIFPEGISHNSPSLAELRTGAARIALGGREAVDGNFPIIPLGLIPERKERFRSRMLVVLGTPVPWSDLATRGAEDREAVRELTRRLDEALRKVTLNLQRWEDRPLVEYAEAIWSLRAGTGPDAARRVERLEVTTRILAHLRTDPHPRWTAILRRVRGHARRLGLLAILPKDLESDRSLRTAMRATFRNAILLGPPAFLAATAGGVIFYVPRQLTGTLADIASPEPDRRSTYQLLIGAGLYTLWTLLWAVAAGVVAGPLWALAVAVGVPAVGVLGRLGRERWAGAWDDVRKFFTLRSRRALTKELAEEQRMLADDFQVLYEAWVGGELGSTERE